MERGCKVKMAKYHQFLKYFAKKEKTLSEKIVINHFFWYSSLVSSSTIFFNPPWHNDMAFGN